MARKDFASPSSRGGASTAGNLTAGAAGGKGATRSAGPEGKSRKATFLQEIPLLIWLVLVWAILWQNFTIGNLVFGLIIALVVTRLFPLPPIELSGRFNVLKALAFALEVLGRMALSAVQVTWAAIARGPKVRNAVIAVPLRTSSDLIMTATGHVSSWIPGSMVVEVDRSTSTLYLHALDVNNDQQAEMVKNSVRRIEAKLIGVMGTREELDALKMEAGQ